MHWKETEFLEFLESHGIDTVCFMGQGYDISLFDVGTEFYYSYAYIGRDAKKEKYNILHDCLTAHNIAIENNNASPLTDRFKIISKHNDEYAIVRNIRTNVDYKINDIYRIFHYMMVV